MKMHLPAPFILIPALLAPAYAQSAGENPSTILAVQIRERGYPCEQPVKAEPDPDFSRPDQAAWIVTCGTTSYRLRFSPHQATNVERMK